MSVFCAGSELFSSLGIVLMYFHILIKVRSDHNKLNRFLSVLNVHAMQDASKRQPISSLDLVVVTSHGGNFMLFFKQELIIISLLNVNYFSWTHSIHKCEDMQNFTVCRFLLFCYDIKWSLHISIILWNFKIIHCQQHLRMYLSVYKKFGVHMKFLSWIKNSSKTGKIAVDLTELSSSTNEVIFTWIALIVIIIAKFCSDHLIS